MKKYIFALIIVSISILTNAQTLKSGYFLENVVYRHQLNPAFHNNDTYFSMPILGNTNIGLESNIGLSTFLYPSSNPKYKLTTFLDPSVSTDDFLNKLNNNNKIAADINLQIISVGKSMFNGYATLDIGLKTQLSASVPKDLFKFIKYGMNSTGTTLYEMDNFGLSSNAYIEIALGYSRQITEKIRIGAKTKFLIGAAYANVDYKNMTLKLSEDKWDIAANGTANMAVPSLGFKTELKDGKNKITGVSSGGNISPCGGGLAFDLGATYEIIDGLEISAAILDLGFIKWNKVSKATSDSEYTFEGFENIATNKDDEEYEDKKIETQLDNLGEDLKNVFVVYTDNQRNSITRALAATLNIGAQYTAPFYDRLSFGFLSSTRIVKRYSTSEGRFYANVNPTDWFGASVNYAISSFGSSLGWMLNFYTKGFNLYIGSDNQFFKVSPQFIPIKRINSNIAIGINFPLG